MVRQRHTSTTNVPNVFNRHDGAQRRSHGGSFDPTVTTNPLYGGHVTVEPVWWPDVQGEIVGSGNIQPGAVTPGTIAEGAVDAAAFDSTPPDIPTGLTLSTFNSLTTDGVDNPILRVQWTPPADSDFNGIYVQITDVSVEDNGDDPDWTHGAVYFAGRELDLLDVSVRGGTQFWVRIRSVDLLGNRSDFTDPETIVSASDVTPPAVPLSPEAIAGFKGAAFRWAPVSVSDLLEYEVAYSPDDGTGTAPDAGGWVYLRTRSTVIWVTGLTPGERYWLRVQSIDRSGNESGFTVDDLDTTSVVPTQVGSEDLAANSVTASHISAAGISADAITTGVLAVGTVGGQADGIKIYDAGATTPDKLVGEWDETGLRVYASDTKLNYVHITDASVTVYKGGVAITAMTPDGIDATAIRFGRLSGGHNLIQNSSFEVGSFSSESEVGNASFTPHTSTRTSKASAVVTINGGAW